MPPPIMKPAMPVSPLPNPLPLAGEGANESLRDFHTLKGSGLNIPRKAQHEPHPGAYFNRYYNLK